jgi:hypothetical protein
MSLQTSQQILMAVTANKWLDICASTAKQRLISIYGNGEAAYLYLNINLQYIDILDINKRKFIAICLQIIDEQQNKFTENTMNGIKFGNWKQNNGWLNNKLATNKLYVQGNAP